MASVSTHEVKESVFNRETISDRRQVGLYGASLLFLFLATDVGFLQWIFGTTSLTGEQWLTTILVASSVIVVDEVIKFFMRRQRKWCKHS